jgi:hypothetical protein
MGGVCTSWQHEFSLLFAHAARHSTRDGTRLEAGVNPIERLFLKARHWQLFVLLVGVMVAGEMVVLNAFPTSAPTGREFGRSFALLTGTTAVLMLCLLGWFWAMGTFLSSIAGASRLQARVFQLAVIYPAAYIVALAAAAFLWPAAVNAIPPIFPFQILATACMFYDLYFVSKSLVTVETGRAVTFYDFSGPFFLLWFFPIGVWIIQPRINRLFKERADRKPTDRAGETD